MGQFCCGLLLGPHRISSQVSPVRSSHGNRGGARGGKPGLGSSDTPSQIFSKHSGGLDLPWGTALATEVENLNQVAQ